MQHSMEFCFLCNVTLVVNACLAGQSVSLRRCSHSSWCWPTSAGSSLQCRGGTFQSGLLGPRPVCLIICTCMYRAVRPAACMCSLNQSISSCQNTTTLNCRDRSNVPFRLPTGHHSVRNLEVTRAYLTYHNRLMSLHSCTWTPENSSWKLSSRFLYQTRAVSSCLVP